MHFSAMYQYCPVCGSNSFIINNEKSKHCMSCHFTLYVNPSSAVAAFIENEKGELLVCRRAKEPAKGTLDLPGGFVDAAETAEQAIAREISEELHAIVTEARYLFSLPNEYEYSGLTIPTLDMFYACRVEQTGQLTPADDVEECFFIAKEAIQPEEFGLTSVRKAVKQYCGQG